MEYEIVIGLEVHAELATKSKIFCSCTTEFGGEPNTHCCPICTGMPGVLPVLNKKAVEYAIMAGLATNCQIARYSKQDRKNYFYPDLPKAYQISQYDLPLCYNGYIDIEVNGQKKRIGIKRIHIEEDAGKLLHDQWEEGSLVDFNRCGVPLIEIVTEPDLRSSEETRIFLEKLKAILQYTEVSDCKMQEGSLRVDVNLSVRPKGSKEFGTRTEMKNLNSFRSVVRAIEYEARRQIEVLESGGVVIQETRRWDDAKGISLSMRTKEEAHDYRYFPEPDLPPIIVDEKWIEEIRKKIPELPDQKKERYIKEYGLPEYDAGVLTSSKPIANYFEECIKYTSNIKAASNWMMGEIMRILNDKGLEPEEIDNIKIKPNQLASLINLVDNKTISNTIAKQVFEEMFETGKDPEVIVKEKGLVQITDRNVILEAVKQAIANNPKSVEDYKNGKDKAFGFLVGQVMKITKGKANPQLVNEILKEELEKI
ncbi:Asp-tRNA(Asn)/Glu-tRNA(Gln) amidotransferase subunit GatB [Caldicellulosiruptor changbaiensis]|uniref:Aspartyl/glutamyl-tRNA(Asn/Gln) amidotransferase subunit B n=1 Tax=Caldicellulosiruptor changbaiensis TaxID=1222016 RepID=A0A3T0D7T1_9FIRM|nr:Asp-tRNA(Asn)/Glu-tRNA(Gln) amidotransferase subunit GatB [Caldicellulosiruptor changbaiensis]AZT91009.1 Asp-tRNA(Asn)/Glu-tRNA(Gln) amidotransferase subunit GatB [Caldicellulosiruptor changbaiensis]